ncbi:MAG: copper transporter [Mycobacteriales bacterium]
MIDFRYHIVSLTAVFLALAVGVVLGTTALKGPILADLRGQVSRLADDNRGLRQDLRTLKSAAGKQDSFAEQVAPAVLAGRLSGKSVTVISGPGGDTKDRDAVVADLNVAGAKVVSRVRLASDFTDPKRSAELKGLVSQLLPAGVQIPESADGAAQAGRLLAAVLSNADSKTTVGAATRLSVLSGFQSLGLVAVDGDITGSADLAVILTTPPDTTADAKLRNASMLKFVTEFDNQAKATVLGADSATGDGNVVAGIRSDDSVAKSMTTVDDVGDAAGRIAVVLSLAAEAKGVSGQYGIGNGATSRLPPFST